VVIVVTLRLDDLVREGKDFKWERPAACPKCGGKLWSHGFTSRFFQGFSDLFWLKRFRCPGCKAILTPRPEGYWPRIQSDIESIYRTLQERLNFYVWPPGVPRQRAGHWLRGFHRKLALFPHWRAKDDDLTAALATGRGSGLRFV